VSTNLIRVVAIAFPANPLDLLYLTSLAGGLDVFEVDVRLLAEVYDGAEEVEQPWKVGGVSSRR